MKEGKNEFPSMNITPGFSEVTGNAVKKILESVKDPRYMHTVSFIHIRDEQVKAGAITLEDANTAAKEYVLPYLIAKAEEESAFGFSKAYEDWVEKTGVVSKEEIIEAVREIARKQIIKASKSDVLSFNYKKDFWKRFGVVFDGLN